MRARWRRSPWRRCCSRSPSCTASGSSSGSASMADVRIENLTCRYGEVTAVDDVSLHIADGEFVTLLGPSGCGKSTTLAALAGLDVPHAGRISVGGEVFF